MLKPGVSFVEWMVEPLPYKPDIPGSIPGDGPNPFRFFKLKTKSSQILSLKNPVLYPDTMSL